MEFIGTCFFYLFLMFILYTLCKNGQSKNKKEFIIIAYVLLFIVSAIRYDVGNDYDRYVDSINYIITHANMPGGSLLSAYELSGTGELSFVLISWIVGLLFTAKVYYLVFAVYSFISVFFLYKAFDKFKCHSVGLLVYFLIEALFFTWDGIRQGAALSVVLYAFSFVYEKKFLKYCLLIGIATFLHTSAVIMLPVYFLHYVTIDKRICVGLIIVVLIGFWTGIFADIVEQASIIFSYMDNDYSRYENADFATLTTYDSLNWKIRVTIYALFWMTAITALDDEKNFYALLMTIGSIVFILANGSLIFYRISLYFSIATAVAVPLAYNYKIKKKKLNHILLIIMLLGMGLFFIYDSATGSYSRGCVPYKTVFSEDAQIMKFKN